MNNTRNINYFTKIFINYRCGNFKIPQYFYETLSVGYINFSRPRHYCQSVGQMDRMRLINEQNAMSVTKQAKQAKTLLTYNNCNLLPTTLEACRHDCCNVFTVHFLMKLQFKKKKI